MGIKPIPCPLDFGTSLWTLEGKLVSYYGCADDDGDGYSNLIDDCLLTSGSSRDIRWGCPDADGDGIEDLEDDCPTFYGNSMANLVGCSDSDGDGIADLEDPETASFHVRKHR